MNKILMKAIIEFLVFLGLSEDDFINLDTSVAQFESLASTLKELTSEDKMTFLEYVKELAQQTTEEGNEEHTKFLLSLPENLGLSD